MRIRAAAAAALLALAGCSAAPPLPIASGTHRFQHRFAEHPDMPSIALDGVVEGRRIRLVNAQDSSVFPKGVIAEGELVWHRASGQWIVAADAADRDAVDVGGCSDGPEVVDLVAKVYWTC